MYFNQAETGSDKHAFQAVRQPGRVAARSERLKQHFDVFSRVREAQDIYRRALENFQNQAERAVAIAQLQMFAMEAVAQVSPRERVLIPSVIHHLDKGGRVSSVAERRMSKEMKLALGVLLILMLLLTACGVSPAATIEAVTTPAASEEPVEATLRPADTQPADPTVTAEATATNAEVATEMPRILLLPDAGAKEDSEELQRYLVDQGIVWKGDVNLQQDKVGSHFFYRIKEGKSTDTSYGLGACVMVSPFKEGELLFFSVTGAKEVNSNATKVTLNGDGLPVAQDAQGKTVAEVDPETKQWGEPSPGNDAEATAEPEETEEPTEEPAEDDLVAEDPDFEMIEGLENQFTRPLTVQESGWYGLLSQESSIDLSITMPILGGDYEIKGLRRMEFVGPNGPDYFYVPVAINDTVNNRSWVICQREAVDGHQITDEFLTNFMNSSACPPWKGFASVVSFFPNGPKTPPDMGFATAIIDRYYQPGTLEQFAQTGDTSLLPQRLLIPREFQTGLNY